MQVGPMLPPHMFRSRRFGMRKYRAPVSRASGSSSGHHEVGCCEYFPVLQSSTEPRAREGHRMLLVMIRTVSIRQAMLRVAIIKSNSNNNRYCFGSSDDSNNGSARGARALTLLLTYLLTYLLLAFLLPFISLLLTHLLT